MEPFAYQRPRTPDYRKLVLMLLAAASFSIWFFDLVPQMAPIDTGHLEGEPHVSDADFLALLDAPRSSTAPSTDAIVDEDAFDAQQSAIDEDPLLAALNSQPDPIEDSFPEFAHAGTPVTEPEPEAVDVTTAAEAEAATEATTAASENAALAVAATAAEVVPENGVVPAGGISAGMEASVQQTAFELSPSAGTLEAAPVLSPEVAAKLHEVDSMLTTGEILQAHAALSRLYWKQPELRSFIASRMEETAAEIYANRDAHFADPYVVQFGETLDSIAKQFDVPWQYLGRLNGVTPKTLQAGQKLKVLKGPFGAVVDLARFEMTVHAHGWFVRRYSIGIGRDHRTPQGEFTVQNKLENPTWYDPQGGQIEGDDPENPLGEYWLGLGDHIGIHGTIDASTIGKAASRGCIHLQDNDIAEVFQLLGVGSKVVIRE